MAKGDVHTTWDAERGQRKNERTGAARPSGLYPTKDEARLAGQATARRERVEWVGHRKADGRINERNSYGEDPHPPRG